MRTHALSNRSSGAPRLCDKTCLYCLGGGPSYRYSISIPQNRILITIYPKPHSACYNYEGPYIKPCLLVVLAPVAVLRENGFYRGSLQGHSRFITARQQVRNFHSPTTQRNTRASTFSNVSLIGQYKYCENPSLTTWLPKRTWNNPGCWVQGGRFRYSLPCRFI